jgi:hypothetical protein
MTPWIAELMFWYGSIFIFSSASQMIVSAIVLSSF